MIKVFLIDDHNVLRQGISQVIDAQLDMHVVGQAENPKGLLDQIAKVHPDVILMDISLPGMTGIDLSKEIKAQHADAKIIILSMHNTAEYVYSAIDAGLEGYILKEAQMEELLFAIRTVYEGNSYIYPSLTEKVFAKLRGDDKYKKRFEDANLEKLVDKDLEILRYVAHGLSNQEISVRMQINEKTVRNRLSNIFKELNVSNRTEAAILAVANGLVDIDSGE